MKWKELFFSALLSMLVSVIGGVGTYYFTKDPDLSKIEQLSYQLISGGVFKGGTSELALSSLNMKNIGGGAASNVKVLLTFENSIVKDISLDSSDGIKEFSRELKEKSVKIGFDKLFPTESLTINLLLSSQETPKVSIRSDASIATQKIFYSNSKSKLINNLKVVISIYGLLLFVTLLVMLKISRSLNCGFGNSKNNTGFLLMHAGLLDQAFRILSSKIESGCYDAITLSNLALCSALKGDSENAERYKVASCYKNLNTYEKAIYDFNESIILIFQEKIDDGLDKLERAINASPEVIKKYCKYSVHFNSLKHNERFANIISEVKKTI